MTRAPKAQLEEWMRLHYRVDACDIGSSGVAPIDVADVLDENGARSLLTTVLADGEPTGTLEIRMLIAEAWGRGDPSEVVATHGSSEALFLAFGTMLNPGDRVVVQRPTYHALENLPRFYGCEVVHWDMPLDDGRPDASELRNVVRRSNPKLIALNFPHNPTGLSLSRDELDDVLGIVESTEIHLLWDGAFSDLTYDEQAFPRVTAADLPARSLYIGGASKSLGAPGLRLGWCIAPASTIAESLPIRDLSTLHLSPLVETIGVAVLRHRNELVSSAQSLLDENLHIYRSKFRQGDGLRSAALPNAGATVFPRVGFVRDTTELARALSHVGVLVVPGMCFGVPDRLRIGLGAAQPDEFARGLDALLSAVDEHEE